MLTVLTSVSFLRHVVRRNCDRGRGRPRSLQGRGCGYSSPPRSTSVWISPADVAADGDRVVTAEPVERQLVVCGLGVVDLDGRENPVHNDGTPVRRDLDVIRVVRAVDRDRVGRAVARSAADRGLEVERDALEIGPGRVVHDRVVGPAERLDVDELGVVQVHRDRALSAEEPEAVAVGRDVEVLGHAGPVEEHRVGAVLTFDDVAAVARIPDEGVVAGTHEPGVGASVSVDRVVAAATDEALGSVAAVDPVVPVAAVDRDLDQGCQAGRARDRVVAGEPVDVQDVVRSLRVLDLHGRGQSGHVDGTRVGCDRDRVVAAGAVDRGRVDRRVVGEVEHGCSSRRSRTGRSRPCCRCRRARGGRPARRPRCPS